MYCSEIESERCDYITHYLCSEDPNPQETKLFSIPHTKYDNCNLLERPRHLCCVDPDKSETVHLVLSGGEIQDIGPCESA